jgi:hypothetical protein
MLLNTARYEHNMAVCEGVILWNSYIYISYRSSSSLWHIILLQYERIIYRARVLQVRYRQITETDFNAATNSYQSRNALKEFWAW